MAEEKRPYITPKVTRYKSIDQLPAKLRPIAEEILRARPTLTVTVDEHRRNVSVSEEFARFAGLQFQ